MREAAKARVTCDKCSTEMDVRKGTELRFSWDKCRGLYAVPDWTFQICDLCPDCQENVMVLLETMDIELRETNIPHEVNVCIYDIYREFKKGE